jgi:hypothetical protein
MKFSNAKDFLTYLQNIWTIKVEPQHNNEQKKWNEDFFTISKERNAEVGNEHISAVPGIIITMN